MQAMESGDTPHVNKPQLAHAGDAAPIRFRPMVRSGDEGNAPPAANQASVPVIPPPADRVGVYDAVSEETHAFDTAALRASPYTEADASPAHEDPSRPLLDHAHFETHGLDPQYDNHKDRLFAKLTSHPDLAIGELAPLPPSEHVAHLIVNRQGQREWVISPDSLATNMQRVALIPRVGPLALMVARTIVEQYHDLPYGPDEHADRTPEPPADPKPEHHPVVAKQDLEAYAQSHGQSFQTPRAIGSLVTNFTRHDDLATEDYADSPLSPSDRPVYNIINRDYKPETVVSLPNFARHFDRLSGVNQLGRRQMVAARALLAAYEHDRTGEK
jgi:hypothetical protein